MVNEDRLEKVIEQSQEALIQEMLRDAKVEEIPSELAKEPIVHKGDATLEAPMVFRKISSAGYVWVWDTRSFEKIPVLYYMLASKLRQRRLDGSFRFTTADPGRLPARGAIKCMLHKDSENRKHYDELGFRVCSKDNITNLYQLRQHMLKKHPQEWAAIEAERLDKERAEDRALQRLLLANQIERSKATEEAPKVEERELYVSDKDKKKLETK